MFNEKVKSHDTAASSSQAACSRVLRFNFFVEHGRSLNKSNECRCAGVCRHRHGESVNRSFVVGEIQDTHRAIIPGLVNQSPSGSDCSGPRGRGKIYVSDTAGRSGLRAYSGRNNLPASNVVAARRFSGCGVRSGGLAKRSGVGVQRQIKRV